MMVQKGYKVYVSLNLPGVQPDFELLIRGCDASETGKGEGTGARAPQLAALPEPCPGFTIERFV
jgi:hypothetical protein